MTTTAVTATVAVDAAQMRDALKLLKAGATGTRYALPFMSAVRLSAAGDGTLTLSSFAECVYGGTHNGAADYLNPGTRNDPPAPC